MRTTYVVVPSTDFDDRVAAGDGKSYTVEREAGDAAAALNVARPLGEDEWWVVDVGYSVTVSQQAAVDESLRNPGFLAPVTRPSTPNALDRGARVKTAGVLSCAAVTPRRHPPPLQAPPTRTEP